MPRAARSGPSPHGPPPTQIQVVNEKLEKRRDIVGNNDIPVRTVIYIEVGKLPPQEVQAALAQINQHYCTNAHPVFVIPLREGRAYTDVFFENEILDIVRSICEVQDGQIMLKGEPTEVDVYRTRL